MFAISPQFQVYFNLIFKISSLWETQILLWCFEANEVFWSHISIAHALEYGGPLTGLLVYTGPALGGGRMLLSHQERPEPAPHSRPGAGLYAE